MMIMAATLLCFHLVFVVLWSLFIVLHDVTGVLLLYGDVQLNPGPSMHYPCAMCYCPVRWNQKALLCDACGLWSHCKCCRVSGLEYSRLQGLNDFSWHCPSCTVKILPFHDCSILTSGNDIPLACSDDNISELPAYPQKCGGLRIAHLNCHSLLPHKEEIFNLMCDAQIDVLALCWMILFLIMRFFLLALVYHSFMRIEIVMEAELRLLFLINFVFVLDLI